MTTQTLWIVVAVVAAVVLIAVGLGLVLRRQRRISLRQAEELESDARPDVTPPRRGGTYPAGRGFNFSAGADPATPPRPDTPPTRPQPGDTQPGDTQPVRPDAGEGTPPLGIPTQPAADEPIAVSPDTRAGPRPQVDAPSTEPSGAEPTSGGTTARPVPDTAAPEPPAERTTPEPPAERTTPDEPAPTGPSVPRNATPTAVPPMADERSAPPTSAGDAQSPDTPSVPRNAPQATPAPLATPVPTTTTNGAASAPAAPTEEIAPPGGRLERLRGRLSRSRSGFGQGLLGLLGAGELDEESWEDVEATLLQADLGPDMTAELVDALRTQLASRGVRTAEQARQLLRDVLTEALRSDLDRSVRALPHDGRPAVLLVVGVNGTGKTTTTGKLARVLVASGHHVVLGAADTFRAAAAEQLMTWGERAGATVIRGAEGADPASVAFDAVKRGTEEGADVVLLDTAGRLHTRTGLMDELDKIKRVVTRQAEVDEVLLVLDATTGQNGLTQARVFGEVVKVTGIVLTKLDGTAKGGIVFRVQRELGVPVKLVGLGEGPDDLAPFEPAAYVDALLN